MKDYIDKGENLIKRPIHLGIKNKIMAYCSDLPYGILSYSSYIDHKKMKIVSSFVGKKQI